jgi:hypothetical protein
MTLYRNATVTDASRESRYMRMAAVKRPRVQAVAVKVRTQS